MTKRSWGLALAGLTACGVEQLALESTAGLSFEEFEALTAREPGTDAYVVDGDIVIHDLEELRAFHARFQQGALAIYSANGADVRWNATQRKQLTYCVSDAFGPRKQAVVDALREAHDAGWETFADVDFTYVPAYDASCTGETAGVMFDVNPIRDAPYLARAFFPSEGRPYRNILVNDSAFAHGIPLGGVLAHELGHVLGFRHEHIRPEAANTEEDCVEDERFRGVTPYDSASVMHYPQCHGTASSLAFTERDREGAVLVYGAPGQTSAPAPRDPEAPEVEPETVAATDAGGCSSGGGETFGALLLVLLVLVRRATSEPAPAA